MGAYFSKRSIALNSSRNSYLFIILLFNFNYYYIFIFLKKIKPLGKNQGAYCIQKAIILQNS